VVVSASNLQFDAFDYINELPHDSIRQIHLAGHSREIDEDGCAVLIDTHDRQVDELVWQLYAYTVRRSSLAPTLVEWDAHIPAWDTLFAEAVRADALANASCATRSEESHCAYA
jgi:hypothetical protein